MTENREKKKRQKWGNQSSLSIINKYKAKVINKNKVTRVNNKDVYGSSSTIFKGSKKSQKMSSIDPSAIKKRNEKTIKNQEFFNMSITYFNKGFIDCDIVEEQEEFEDSSEISEEDSG